MISNKKIKQIAEKIGLNIDIIDLKTIQKGINVEMEHGYINPKTNITNNDIKKTMMIALAHIDEYPDYYDRLLKMEKRAKKYWSKKDKPNIWL